MTQALKPTNLTQPQNTDVSVRIFHLAGSVDSPEHDTGMHFGERVFLTQVSVEHSPADKRTEGNGMKSDFSVRVKTCPMFIIVTLWG